jgi:glutamate dehydrogenase
MRERFAAAIDGHRLRGEIVATKIANRLVNRLGPLPAFELAEEEGVDLSDIARMFVVAERLFGLRALWADIDAAAMPEPARIALFEETALAVRSHIADLLRVAAPATPPQAVIDRLANGIAQLDRQTDTLLLDEVRAHGQRIADQLTATGAPADLVARVVRLFELDGAVGLADLGVQLGLDEAALTRAYTRLGQALGLDWAQGHATRLSPADPWERLLIAGLVREFEQLRLGFLARTAGPDPQAAIEAWLTENARRVGQFAAMMDRARLAPQPSAAMLAQVAGQARVLPGRDEGDTATAGAPAPFVATAAAATPSTPAAAAVRSAATIAPP